MEARYREADGSPLVEETKLRRHSYIHTEIGHNWFYLPNVEQFPDDFTNLVIEEWASEGEFYNRDDRSCSGICQQFMQVVAVLRFKILLFIIMFSFQIVSAVTFKVGCSAQLCNEAIINGALWPKGILYVCSYTPRGGAMDATAFDRDSLKWKYSMPIKSLETYREEEWCSDCDSSQGVLPETSRLRFRLGKKDSVKDFDFSFSEG